MEKLLEILNDIQPDADYETCTTLIDDEVLDSFAILSIVGELEEAFDIEITPVDIVPENFNSAQALWAMVQRLLGAYLAEEKHVRYIDGIPDICGNRGNRLLSDSEKIPVDMAADLQLYLLCIIGNQDSVLPALYHHHHLRDGKTLRSGEPQRTAQE